MTLQNLLDFKFFASQFFKIRTKSGAVVPFIFNKTQRYIDSKLDEQLQKTGMVRAIILKGRQQGCSTYVQGRYTHKVITKKGQKAYILTHEKDATDNLFEITRRYIDNLPAGLCPKPDNSTSNELYFKKFDSGYAVGTAGNKGAGRSQTLQLFHGSEVGFWPNAEDHAKGVMEAISREAGTEIILESTANGMGGYFHMMWQGAEKEISEYQAIFVPWYWEEKYTSELTENFLLDDEEEEIYNNYSKDGLTYKHLMWRRLKITGFNALDLELGKENFKQEYPFTATEAFRNTIAETFIKANYVMKARKIEVETNAGLIIGVDPALGNKDKLAIIRRRGCVAYDLKRHVNFDAMQIVGLVRNIIDRENPVKVYIDVIGIGAGIVSRLLELGYTEQVEGVNSARASSDPIKFANKRAEMWHDMREWLYGELPVQIPDSDVLHTDLCNLGSKIRSNGQLLIEPKENLKKRGLDSPDTADALALTFAGGVYNFLSGEREYRDMTHKLTNKFY